MSDIGFSHHWEILLGAKAHNIVEQLKTDVTLALCEGRLKSVEVEGGGEDVAGGEVFVNVKATFDCGHHNTDEVATSAVDVSGALFLGADGFAVGCGGLGH